MRRLAAGVRGSPLGRCLGFGSSSSASSSSVWLSGLSGGVSVGGGGVSGWLRRGVSARRWMSGGSTSKTKVTTPQVGDSTTTSKSGSNWPLSRVLGVLVFGAGAVTSLQLGNWQLQRRAWKEELIATRSQRVAAPPRVLDEEFLATVQREQAEFLASGKKSREESAASSAKAALLRTHPVNAKEVEPPVAASRGKYAFRRVEITGALDYEREVRLGPRGAPPDTPPGVSIDTAGYYLVTPLTLDSGETIMLNRGWVCRSEVDAQRYEEETDEEGRTTVLAVFRDGEKTPPYYVDTYDEAANAGKFRRDYQVLDLSKIGAQLGRSEDDPPLLLADVIEPTKRWPLRRSVKDFTTFNVMPMMHNIYAATWYSLAVAIAVLSFIRFRKPPTAVRRSRRFG